MQNQTLKTKISKEIIDFLSLISLFFLSMVIFAFVGCPLIAGISLLLIYILSVSYTIRWLFLGALALYKNLKSQHKKETK